MAHTEIHKKIKDNDVVELYVLNKLSAEERLAFQEHFFECEQCFEQAQIAARFIAGVREASRSGVLAAHQPGRVPFRNRLFSGVLNQRWAGAWIMPALAASLLLAVTLTVLWALSLRRENWQLADLRTEQNRTSDELQRLEAKIRELEISKGASQQQRETLGEENRRLKAQLEETERQLETRLAQLKQPDINVPVRNIYPVGDSQRSNETGETNRIRVPRGTRTFVLILGEYKPGFSDYRVDVIDPFGRQVARRRGLKPDQGGELSVMLNRTGMKPGKYRLKLYGGQQRVAEYVIQVE